MYHVVSLFSTLHLILITYRSLLSPLSLFFPWLLTSHLSYLSPHLSPHRFSFPLPSLIPLPPPRIHQLSPFLKSQVIPFLFPLLPSPFHPSPLTPLPSSPQSSQLSPIHTSHLSPRLVCQLIHSSWLTTHSLPDTFIHQLPVNLSSRSSPLFI